MLIHRRGCFSRIRQDIPVASTTTIHRTDFWKRNQLLGVILYSVIRHNFHPHIGRYAQQTSPLPTKRKPIRLQLTSQHVPASPEGYMMEINDKGACISARTMTGIFYGCQTLEQLMEDSRDFNILIPAMLIIDYPAISYRAVHFDVKHHLDRMEYYYQEIDKLARYKINAVIWELEDKLRYTRRPEIGAPNAISKQEMQALCRYAKERNIEITPWSKVWDMPVLF